MELRGDKPNNDPYRRLDATRPAGKDVESKRDAQVQQAHDRAASARQARADDVSDLRERSRARAVGSHSETTSADRVDLSRAARLYASQDGDEVRNQEARAALVRSLGAAYRSGDLNTRERIERAAEHLLGGE